MKKILVSFIGPLFLVSLVSLTSCQKEEQATGKQFRAVMEDCTDLHNAKTVLNGTALEWVSGDRVKMLGNSGNGVCTATPQSPATTAVLTLVEGELDEEAPYLAYYPAEIYTNFNTVTLPAVQSSTDGSLQGFPMFCYSTTDNLQFKNLCGVLKLNLQKAGTTVTSIAITANTEINGRFSINGMFDNQPSISYDSYSNTGTNTTTLECNQSIATAHDFYIYLPAGNYTGLQITINTADSKTCTKTANTTIPITRSQYTTVTLGGSDLVFRPIGSKGGLFSVSATQQVWFSQGNLQYQASTNTWRFAEHQYDYVGSANSNVSSTYSGWIDLFGWGTSGWNSGAVCYQPWSTSTTPSDYYPGGSYTNGLTDDYVEADWAWHNAISNGGNTVHQWRTLTSAEWDYLLNTRTDASTKLGIGNINGVGGLIILPDSWTLPSGCSFTSGLASSYNDWTRNNYTLSQWKQMESAGAVFLPAAGRCGPYYVNYVGDYGGYWSSTPHSSFAYYMYLASDYLHATSDLHRYYRFSVRPVQDYN